MGLVSEIAKWRHFNGDLKAFVQSAPTVREARAFVKHELEHREDNLIRLLEKDVFGNPKSPYLPLFRHADCGLQDVVRIVRRDGLETALRMLRESGVYFSFEEYKGRMPVVRDGKEFPLDPSDFDNPAIRGYFKGRTGGSTGRAIDVRSGFDRYLTIHSLLQLDLYGLVGAPSGSWMGFRGRGVSSHAFSGALLPHAERRSFHYVPPEVAHGKDKRPHRKGLIALIARMHGVKLTESEVVPPDQGIRVARWAKAMVEKHGRCIIRGYVSSCMRVSLAAMEAGIDLKGVTMFGSGEPPTEAKVEKIRASGADWIPFYVFSEGGNVGWGCTNPADCNDQHYLAHTLAMIQYPRLVPGTDIEVDAFLFTTLRANPKKILLNVESDDYGVVERRSCGCPLEAFGFPTHIRHIRSFAKLTSEGMTLLGSEMLRVLEEVLPERFGASPLDFQLSEEEDEKGFTRLVLRVSPKVSANDDDIRKTLLGGLTDDEARRFFRRDGTRALWEGAGTVRIVREEPKMTSAGKIQTLHLGSRKK